MKNKIVVSLSALAILGSSLIANEQMFNDYAVGLKAGTLGGGLEVTTNMTDNLNLRVGANTYKYSTSVSDSDVDYDADLKLLTFNILADYYPFEASQFRLTGGAMYNKNKLDMSGKPESAGTFEFNDVTYTTAQVGSVDASVKFNSLAPYLGIGWGNAVKKAGWNFTADLGVMFQGTPKTDISVNTTLTGAAKTTLLNNIKEEQDELDSELSGYKYYPVASIGVSYRF